MRAVAKETGFVDGEILQQRGKFSLSVATGEQAIVAVEAIETARSKPALQTVLKKMDAALVKMHSAFLVHQRLQELEFGVADADRNSGSSH